MRNEKKVVWPEITKKVKADLKDYRDKRNERERIVTEDIQKIEKRHEKH